MVWLPRRPAINIDDLADRARRRLPRVIWDFLDGGAEDEVTLRCNRLAFDRYRFNPRVATGNGHRSLQTTLFGQQLAAPFMIGPTGLNGIFRPDADLILARSAHRHGIGFALSMAANASLEAVAAASKGLLFFQMYPWGRRELSARVIDRAQAAGYAGLVVTLDSLIPGNRERDVRNQFQHAVRLTPGIVWDGLIHPRWLCSTWLRRGMPRMDNLVEFLPAGADAYALARFTRTQRNPFYAWDDIAWVRSRWHGPLLVKGLLTPEDAAAARSHGVDGVIVSNHGGRALDGAPATLDVLPAMVEAAGDMPVLVDSGFRRGSDIVKALALGARCVLLGRATLYGLAADGEAGVDRALQLLFEETDRVLGLLGARTVGELRPDHLRLAETRMRQ